MSLSDLEYSISLLNHGFSTWIKYQKHWVVKQQDLKNDFKNDNYVIHNRSLMEEEQNQDGFCLLYNHATQVQQLWETYQNVYKLYQWPKELLLDKREPFVWRELLIFHFCQFKFICKPSMSRIIMCYGNIREVCHRLPLATNTLTNYKAQGHIANVKEFCRLARQIVTSIHYLHTHNIIHGDIKPDNFLIDGQNNIKLTDFGGARLVGLPQYGDTIGTLGFMSLSRMKNGFCSISDDIWAIGITLWYMLFGKTPSATNTNKTNKINKSNKTNKTNKTNESNNSKQSNKTNKSNKMYQDEEEESLIECQFYWQRYKAGSVSTLTTYPFGTEEDHRWFDKIWRLCFIEENTTTCDILLEHLSVKVVIYPVMTRFTTNQPNIPWVELQEIITLLPPLQQKGNHPYAHYIQHWIHEIQYTLYFQRVTYQRQVLIQQVIDIFIYIWIEQNNTHHDNELLDSILFHLLHLSRTPYDIWQTYRRIIEYSLKP